MLCQKQLLELVFSQTPGVCRLKIEALTLAGVVAPAGLGVSFPKLCKQDGVVGESCAASVWRGRVVKGDGRTQKLQATEGAARSSGRCGPGWRAACGGVVSECGSCLTVRLDWARTSGSCPF